MCIRRAASSQRACVLGSAGVRRRSRTRLLSSLALVGSVCASGSALALQAPARAGRPVAGPQVSSGGLEVSPSLAPVRVEVDAGYGAPPAGRAQAWERFLRSAGSRRWEVLWDRDTGAALMNNQIVVTDDRYYTVRSWMAVLSFLMLDYKFLEE